MGYYSDLLRLISSALNLSIHTLKYFYVRYGVHRKPSVDASNMSQIYLQVKEYVSDFRNEILLALTVDHMTI